MVIDGALHGTKVCVPHGLLAQRFVVTVADGLVTVDANAPGVTVVRQDTTSGVPDAMVTFAGALATRLGGLDDRDQVIRHQLNYLNEKVIPDLLSGPGRSISSDTDTSRTLPAVPDSTPAVSPAGIGR